MIQVESKYQARVERTYRENQGHVFRFWDELTPMSREQLLDQVEEIDFTLIEQLHALCSAESTGHENNGFLEPVDIIPVPKTRVQKQSAKDAAKIGTSMIEAGKVAAFVVAGGQGSRLGFDGGSSNRGKANAERQLRRLR